MLKQHAPTWLVQMPALLSAEELEGLQRKTTGATRERMLRELAEALEVITAERPLVLVLEDLHWVDVSTLDWLAFVARRREPACLLVIGTYRPEDVLARGHPLRAVKQELQTHGHCAELLLDFLGEGAVADYLAQRFCAPAPANVGEGRGEGLAPVALRKLARLIHRRTDGNPLFMVNVVNELVARGVLVQSESRWELRETVEEMVGAVPESLQQLIAQQIERLRPETQRLLEVASVAGAEFSAAAVAAGMETDVDVVEEQCEELVRWEHFLRASGTAQWPDGTVAAHYSFRHALYQEVLYHRLTARRRQRVHQQIGEREEQGYGERAREIAAELALHFERGREYRKAVQYLQQAGQNATRRSANQEAINLLTKGLELLKTLPDTSERAQQELTLQITLASPVQIARGFAAPELEKIYTRVQELSQQIGETPQLFVLEGYYLLRAELKMVRELGEQLLTQPQSAQSPARLAFAHQVLGATCFWLGELTSTRAHLEQQSALYNANGDTDPLLSEQAHLEQQSALYNRQHRHSRYAHGPIVCLSYKARVLWLLGYPDQALKKSHEALTLARDFPHPFSLAYAFCFAAAWLYNLRREGHAAQEWAEATITLSTEHGFALPLAVGTWLRGWALAEQGQREEGIAQIHQGLTAVQAIGAELFRPCVLGLLAEVYEKAGQVEEGLTALAEALAVVDKNDERVWEAESYRLKGELTLQQFKVQGSKFRVKNRQSAFRNPQSEAEACFLKAITIAQHQQAKSWELRAATNLARLWQHQGKNKQAHKLLAEVYNWFTEGFETKDLQEAKALIAALEGRGQKGK
jgi:predicted ATPase